MKSKSIAFITGSLVCVLAAPIVTQSADDWVSINDPAELRALYSNKTWRGQAEWSGQPFVNHYSADGRGIVIMGENKYPRTWAVKGKDQVCATDSTGTNCFVFWRQRDNRNEIKAMNVDKGWTLKATVEDGIPNF